MVDVDKLSEGLYIEEYVESQRKEQQQRQANEGLVLAYKTLLKSPDGKKVLWDILSLCGVFRNAMTGNSMTYFKLGQQSVGQYVMWMLNVGNKFDDVLDMQKLKPEEEDE